MSVSCYYVIESFGKYLGENGYSIVSSPMDAKRFLTLNSAKRFIAKNKLDSKILTIQTIGAH